VNTSRIKSRHSIALLIALVFGLIRQGAATAAQVPQIPSNLTLRDAVAISLGTSTSLKEAEKSRLSAAARERIARVSTEFDVGTSANFQRTPSEQNRANRVFGSATYSGLGGTSASLDIAPYATGFETSSVSLELRKPFMRGQGLLSTRSDQLLSARSDYYVQGRSLFITRQATVQDVVESYFGAVRAREQVKVQEQALAIAKETAEFARRRANEGLVAEIEVSRADIRVAQNANELNRQQQAAKAAIDRLMVSMGTGVGQYPELVDDVPEITGEIPTLAVAIESALKNRAELDIADNQISELSRRLAIASDRLRPSLDMVASFNSYGPDVSGGTGSLFDENFVTAGLEYRFYLDPRALREERGVVGRDLDYSRKLRVYRTEQIAEEVRSAYRSAETARTSLDIFSENLRVAELNLKLAGRMVEEGLRDNFEVLQAQESLTRVKNELLSARVNLFLARVNLRRAIGEDISRLPEFGEY